MLILDNNEEPVVVGLYVDFGATVDVVPIEVVPTFDVVGTKVVLGPVVDVGTKVVLGPVVDVGP